MMIKSDERYPDKTRADTVYDRGILFNGKNHKDFYIRYIKKCRYPDVFHVSLIYCLGIDKDTRTHIEQIYDPNKGCVDTTCLCRDWQTDHSRKTTRLAFNLYCNTTPSVSDYDNGADQITELQCYTVANIFSCSYAPYFWQALRLRYPGHCC